MDISVIIFWGIFKKGLYENEWKLDVCILKWIGRRGKRQVEEETKRSNYLSCTNGHTAAITTKRYKTKQKS